MVCQQPAKRKPEQISNYDFKAKQDRREHSIKLSVESSNCLKLLRVTIDEQLNFNTHIIEICEKASQRVGVMLRLKNLSLPMLN